MGLVKGNPLMIVTLFFGAAVLSMGGLYALIPSLLDRITPGIAAIAGALVISMSFSLLVVVRTFWVVARSVPNTGGRRATKLRKPN